MSILSNTTGLPMPPLPPQLPPPEGTSGPGIVSTGWLAAQSSFEHQDEGFIKRTLRASAVSIGLHVVMLLLVLVALAAKPVSDALTANGLVPEYVATGCYVYADL